MNPLLIILPFSIAYAVIRAVMHYRAGRKMWCTQLVIFSVFLAAVLVFELWMQYFADK